MAKERVIIGVGVTPADRAKLQYVAAARGWKGAGSVLRHLSLSQALKEYERLVRALRKVG